MAISGNTVAVGSPGCRPCSQPFPGAVYVFVKPPGGWVTMTQTAELMRSSAPGGDFGHAVAINETASLIAVGAPLTKFGTLPHRGVAFVYQEPTGGWSNAAVFTGLLSSDGATGDLFGDSIGISARTAVAGAPNATVGANIEQGAAYAFAH